MTKTFSLSILIVIITIFFLRTNIYSVEPEEFLENPKQELKARNISKNIRCLVCQNQSIDESTASLAKDLRILIRKKIKEGYTEDEVYKFLTDRYGDFILLRPPFKKSTIVLWFLPFVFLSIGIFVLFWHHKKSKKKLL